MARNGLLFILIFSAAFAAVFESIVVGSPSEPSRPRPSGAGLVPDGLVAYYPFDGTAEEKGGRGRSGVLVGATPRTDRFGEAHGALAFDGADDYVQTESIVTTDDFSFSVWVKDTVRATSTLIYQCRREWYLGSDGAGRLRFGVKLSDQNWYAVESEWNSGSWTHVVGTYKHGASLRLYLNDVLADELRHPPEIPFNSTEFGSSIGAVFGGAAHFYGGALDDFRVYSRVLRPVEVHLLFREPRRNAGPR